MRTHSTRSSHERFLIASTALERAASFSSGATESSRSRNVMSAVTVGALARNRSLDAGVDKQERRGRKRDRSDMCAEPNSDYGGPNVDLRDGSCESPPPAPMYVVPRT